MAAKPIHHTIIHQYDPERHVAGGTPGFIRDLIRYGGRERRFTLISVTHRRDRPLGVKRAVDLGADTPVDFVPVARIPEVKQLHRIPHTARLIAGFLRFRPRIAADIVHFHRAETAMLCSGFVERGRRLMFLHGAGQAHRHGVGGESTWRLIPGAPYDRIERRAIGSADCTYIMDSGRARVLATQFPTIRTGENWYDGGIFGCVDSSPPETVIGWIGRFEHSKDPLLAVRTFRELASRGSRFTAWMAGSGPLCPEIEDALQMFGLTMVSLDGLLAPEHLAARLRRTTVCLATSKWEGIPRAHVEALACGVPVVSTNVGDVRSLIRPINGRLVGPRDPAALITAMEEVARCTTRRSVSDSVARLDARLVVPKLLNEAEAVLLS